MSKYIIDKLFARQQLQYIIQRFSIHLSKDIMTESCLIKKHKLKNELEQIIGIYNDMNKNIFTIEDMNQNYKNLDKLYTKYSNNNNKKL